MMQDLFTSGAIPVLETLVRFAGQRQRIIANNIANLSTPDFRPRDVSTAAFSKQLRAAVEERRARTGGETGDLDLKDTREVERNQRGELVLKPTTASANILFHDRNNRDLERTMQDLVENVTVFRVASDLLRSKYALLQSAIAERV